MRPEKDTKGKERARSKVVGRGHDRGQNVEGKIDKKSDYLVKELKKNNFLGIIDYRHLFNLFVKLNDFSMVIKIKAMYIGILVKRHTVEIFDPMCRFLTDKNISIVILPFLQKFNLINFI